MSDFRTRDGRPVAHAYEYEVIHSEVPDIPVGTFLYDKGQSTQRSWTFWGQDKLPHAVTGQRRRRVCGTCAAEASIYAPYGHPGGHGPQAPRLSAPVSTGNANA